MYPPTGATSFTVQLELLGDLQAECDEGLVIRYSGVYTGDDTPKTARLLIRNDDGPPAGGCPDPFVPDPTAPPPEPMVDAGAGGAGGSPAVDAPGAGGAGGAPGGGAGTDAAPDLGNMQPRASGGGCRYADPHGTSGPSLTALLLALLPLAARRRKRTPSR
jgi:hypothetical protein